MKALEVLMGEHRLIESVLDTLEQGVELLHAGTAVPADFFLQAVEFIREYADGVHHRKEEGILFKAMARHGFSEEAGPVGMMLYEHDQGRQYTAELAAAASRLKAGDSQATTAIVQNALGYAALLRQHIHKEDQILYVMAGRAIPPDELDEMDAQFRSLDQGLDRGAREKYEAVAMGLTNALPR